MKPLTIYRPGRFCRAAFPSLAIPTSSASIIARVIVGGCCRRRQITVTLNGSAYFTCGCSRRRSIACASCSCSFAIFVKPFFRKLFARARCHSGARPRSTSAALMDRRSECRDRVSLGGGAQRALDRSSERLTFINSVRDGRYGRCRGMPTTGSRLCRTIRVACGKRTYTRFQSRES